MALEGDASTRDGLGSVTKGTLVLLLGTVGWIGENFLSRVILARSLTPEQWSVYSTLFAFTLFLTSLGSLGVPQAVARFLPFVRTDAERRSVVRVAFAVAVPSAVVMGLAMYGLSFLLAPRAPLLGVTLEFFALAIAFSILAQVVAAVFQGFEDVRPNAIFVQILSPFLFIVFLGLLDAASPLSTDYRGALAAYAIANGVALVALFFYARSRLPRLLPRVEPAPGVARRLLAFALPLFFVIALMYVTGSADVAILFFYTRLGQLAVVGQYTAALALARLLLVGLTALGYIFLPVATRFFRLGDREGLATTYATATKWMTLVSLPLFLLFFFLPGGSLGFVYGSNFSGGGLALRILVAGAFASTLVGPAAMTLIALGKMRLLVVNAAAGAAVDVGLAVGLVPSMGVEGAAYAWAASIVVLPVLSMVELAVLEGVHPFRADFVKPLAATALPLAALFAFVPIHPPLWALPLVVILIAGTFALAVFATGSVGRGDRILLDIAEGIIGRRIPAVRGVAAWFARRRTPPLPAAAQPDLPPP